MFIRLLLLFTLIPFVEMVLLIEVGKRIGTLSTIALILLTGIVGAALARLQGFYVFSKIREELNHGKLPGDSLLDALFVLVGGLLLLTPGFLTDTVGFLLLFPFTRTLFKDPLKNYFRDKITGHNVTFYTNYEDEDRDPF